jgi:hypothetical protein
VATIRYAFEHSYYPVAGAGFQPALPVQLILGDRTARVTGVLDSGSAVTVFNAEVGELLGIDDLQAGDTMFAKTQAGTVQLFLFDVELAFLLSEAVVQRFPARVGFLPSPRARNILGRNIVFAHYQIGFRERLGRVYVQPED